LTVTIHRFLNLVLPKNFLQRLEQVKNHLGGTSLDYMLGYRSVDLSQLYHQSVFISKKTLQYSCAKSFILLVYLAEKLVKVEP
jgi:hypothetical protein